MTEPKINTTEPAIINLREYVAIKAEKSNCPTCDETVILLCKQGDPGALALSDAYYICSCGFLGKVGVAQLREGTKDHD